MNKANRYWLPVFLWAGVIFGFSSIQVAPALEIYWQDFLIKKTAHLTEYAIFFVLLYRAFVNTMNVSRVKAATISLIIVLLYAISDEYHQSFTPGRQASFRDVVIDTIGGALTWFGLWKYLPKMPKRLRSLAES